MFQKDFISSPKLLTMRMNPFFSTFLLTSLLIIVSGCTKEAKNDSAEKSRLSSSAMASEKNSKNANLLEELLKSVRQATSRFHSTTQAIKAEYEPDEHCVSVPGLGGMGYHWVNQDLVDPNFDPLKPEALLYASGPGGNLRLVGLEYIVIDTKQPRPMFAGKLFDIGGTPVPVDHYSLHVWLYEENPSGLFVPFNPNITCP